MLGIDSSNSRPKADCWETILFGGKIDKIFKMVNNARHISQGPHLLVGSAELVKDEGSNKWKINLNI